MRKLTLYRDDSTTQVVFENVKHFFWTAGNTVLTIAQVTDPATGAHRYIHWPRERFCWYRDEAQDMTDTKDDVELPERSAQNVMMSAHALCPTDMSHPERMAWMADYFMREYARQAVRMERERLARVVLDQTHPVAEFLYGHTREQAVEWAKADKYDSEADKADEILSIVAAAIRKGESRG